MGMASVDYSGRPSYISVRPRTKRCRAADVVFYRAMVETTQQLVDKQTTQQLVDELLQQLDEVTAE